jgi:hypothetical protein
MVVLPVKWHHHGCHGGGMKRAVLALFLGVGMAGCGSEDESGDGGDSTGSGDGGDGTGSGDGGDSTGSGDGGDGTGSGDGGDSTGSGDGSGASSGTTATGGSPELCDDPGGTFPVCDRRATESICVEFRGAWPTIDAHAEECVDTYGGEFSDASRCPVDETLDGWCVVQFGNDHMVVFGYDMALDAPSCTEPWGYVGTWCSA